MDYKYSYNSNPHFGGFRRNLLYILRPITGYKMVTPSLYNPGGSFPTPI